MIDEIAQRFRAGEIIIYPTDTLYAIGCVLTNAESINRLYEIRKNPLGKATLVLVSSLEQAKEFSEIDKNQEKLLKKFWPGEFTFVLKAKENVPGKILGRGRTIALRMPEPPYLLDLIRRVGSPILAPSANFHKEQAKSAFNEIDSRLASLVNYALDLKLLDKRAKLGGEASTLVDLSTKEIKVLRKGKYWKKFAKFLEELK